MTLLRTISLALAGTLAFSTAALAQDNSGDRLSRLDTDGDSVLSLDEFLASRIAANVDRDADGTVTLEEYTANLRRNNSGRFRGAARQGQQTADAEQQSQAETPREQRTEADREERRQRRQQNLAKALEGMDADEDGVVTISEYRAAVFNNIDQDGDGSLQGSELAAQRNRGGARGAGRRDAGSGN